MVECPIAYRGEYGQTAVARKDNRQASVFFASFGLAAIGVGVGVSIVVNGKLSGLWIVGLGLGVLGLGLGGLWRIFKLPIVED